MTDEQRGNMVTEWSEAALPPAPALFLVSSRHHPVTFTPRERLCAASQHHMHPFTKPATGSTSPPVCHSYVKHTHQRVRIRPAAQKTKVQRYTNNTSEAVGGITAHFITAGKKKKSSRKVWLLHNAKPALLEMLFKNRVEHTNEKKARSSDDKLPVYYKVSHSNKHHGKYHRPGTVICYIINKVSISTALLFNPMIQLFTYSMLIDIRDV